MARFEARTFWIDYDEIIIIIIIIMHIRLLTNFILLSKHVSFFWTSMGGILGFLKRALKKWLVFMFTKLVIFCQALMEIKILSGFFKSNNNWLLIKRHNHEKSRGAPRIWCFLVLTWRITTSKCISVGTFKQARHVESGITWKCRPDRFTTNNNNVIFHCCKHWAKILCWNPMQVFKFRCWCKDPGSARASGLCTWSLYPGC